MSSFIIGDYTVSASNQLCSDAIVAVFFTGLSCGTQLSCFPCMLPEGIVFHPRVFFFFFLLMIMKTNTSRECGD